MDVAGANRVAATRRLRCRCYSIHSDPSGDDLMREALGNTGSAEPEVANPGIDPKDFGELKHVVQTLADAYVNDRKQEQQTGAGERVDQLISQYPVLRDDKVSSAFAKDHILTQFAAANGQLNLDQAVQQAATKAQQLSDQAQGPQPPVPVTGGPRLTLPQGVNANARSLQSGDIKRAALEHVRRLQG